MEFAKTERLQKILARAGIASRRKCEELILARRVRVNGQVVAELGVKVDPARDRVEVDGGVLRAENKSYIILHKPRGYLSDVDPAAGAEERGSHRPFALDLVPRGERLYAAGRLDANSEGLLLLTNDGDLAHRLTHPRFEHEKEYLALVQGEPSDESLARIVKGIWYEGERLRADSARVVRHLGESARPHGWKKAQPGEAWISIVLHEGKKHEIRHLCNAVGHPVHRLIRVRIGPITLGPLRCGAWRRLDERQVRELKSIDPQGKHSGSSGSGRYSHRDRRTGGIGKKHDRRSAR